MKKNHLSMYIIINKLTHTLTTKNIWINCNQSIYNLINLFEILENTNDKQISLIKEHDWKKR